ncbi:hypothetical protein [Duganella sp. BuS-21]|uniref:hypothetical protein n=1 Tax=Duganella sp. BuS-21 TaxID=2943848 RepID=UPI0035A59198
MKRLKEASTWAGLGVLFQVAKVLVPPQYHVVLDGLSGLAGAVAGIVPETSAVK